MQQMKNIRKDVSTNKSNIILSHVFL